MRLCEESRVVSSPTNKGLLQRQPVRCMNVTERPQPSGVVKHTRKPTTKDKVKPTSAYEEMHKCCSPTKTHTPLHMDPEPTPSTSGACQCELTDCKCRPAGVPMCDRWLCLPDEVWLSILSLLPHSDLCRVLQVCSRLHTLATDHTLWKDLRIENSNLSERCLLCVGRRRPRSLCLYSCSGLSLTSRGLEMFFTLCRKTLEEVKVTSCTGPRLHGDQMLRLIGQLCDHLTSVDVSWSGASDTGVKALSDCCSGMQLKSVSLNGCHVTGDALMKLVMRHRESLCRLEIFGCHFLTPSNLQVVYEMCPGLEHLNIGQVPKVNAHCLAVITSQLKCLLSLNLTGLQAVTDATVDTLLQNCVKLQSLTFSSCLGVTDLTLHNISKHTPCIRYLNVSGCKAVTDAGDQSLALGCGRLQQLDLSSTGTGNRGVSLLANYCSGHLQTVKLSFCHVTLENILKLCRHCKRLKVLHLYGCNHLPTEREIEEVNRTVKVYPQP
nr:F-box/LRR-repeat protein 7-like isoform X2 [Scatophagus argus]